MSDNEYDSEQVDFEETNAAEESHSSERRENGDRDRDDYSDDGSRDQNDRYRDDGENRDDEKIIKPRTDGGVGVSVNGYIPNVIFISRFVPTISKSEIEDFMGRFGTITEVIIKGLIAFVEFERAEDATAAKETCHMQPGLGAQTLVVDFKRDTYIPAVKV